MSYRKFMPNAVMASEVDTRKYKILTNINDLTEGQRTLVKWSRDIFSYKGYAEGGVVSTWHDYDDTIIEQLNNWRAGDNVFYWVDQIKVDLDAYCILSAIFAKHHNFKDVSSLYGNAKVIKWLKSFRRYCGSRESFSETADLIYHLLLYQVKGPHRVKFTKFNIFKDIDEIVGVASCEDKFAEAYVVLSDRIKLFKVQGIDPKLWIEAKYDKCMKAFNDSVAFSTIVDDNNLDPPLKDLKVQTDDPWRYIRKFLGLSPECEFTDGYIPKGWRPQSSNVEDLKLITQIAGTGHYLYPDGSQRLGVRHYCQNSYLVIKCDPDNFDEFKESWDGLKLLSSMPTWEEYNKYGIKDKVEYDKDGVNTNGRGSSVKWRKK